MKDFFNCQTWFFHYDLIRYYTSTFQIIVNKSLRFCVSHAKLKWRSRDQVRYINLRKSNERLVRVSTSFFLPVLEFRVWISVDFTSPCSIGSIVIKCLSQVTNIQTLFRAMAISTVERIRFSTRMFRLSTKKWPK